MLAFGPCSEERHGAAVAPQMTGYVTSATVRDLAPKALQAMGLVTVDNIVVDKQTAEYAVEVCLARGTSCSVPPSADAAGATTWTPVVVYGCGKSKSEISAAAPAAAAAARRRSSSLVSGHLSHGDLGTLALELAGLSVGSTCSGAAAFDDESLAASGRRMLVVVH